MFNQRTWSTLFTVVGVPKQQKQNGNPYGHTSSVTIDEGAECTISVHDLSQRSVPEICTRDLYQILPRCRGVRPMTSQSLLPSTSASVRSWAAITSRRNKSSAAQVASRDTRHNSVSTVGRGSAQLSFGTVAVGEGLGNHVENYRELRSRYSLSYSDLVILYLLFLFFLECHRTIT